MSKTSTPFINEVFALLKKIIMIQFNKIYFIGFILIFIIEIVIAKYATGFIRHTIGDVLATIFLYCLIKSFISISTNKTLLIVFIISFIIEFLQLTNFQNLYPEKMEKYLRIILGTSFSIGDLIAYLVGLTLVYIVERRNTNNVS